MDVEELQKYVEESVRKTRKATNMCLIQQEEPLIEWASALNVQEQALIVHEPTTLYNTEFPAEGFVKPRKEVEGVENQDVADQRVVDEPVGDDSRV